MTFKERLQIEHPESIDSVLGGGCHGCPYDYGYESKDESLKNCKNPCSDCWNREIPVDDFKVGDKVRLRKSLVIGKMYDGISLLSSRMTFEGEAKVICKTNHGNYLLNTGYYYSPVMLEKAKAAETGSEEREEKKMAERKFKVGDKVRTTKLMDYAENELFPVGTIGKIIKISDEEGDRLPYKVAANGDTWWYSEDMLEKVEFSIEDLKDGMVTEYRNGKRSVVLNQCFCGIDGYGRFGEYNDDLTCKYYQEFDIVKVFKGKRDSIKSILECPGKLIWERKEEPITKDISMEELNAILKEKFPGVDKFNLPIEE